jgi:hypothetical protein
VRIRIRESQAEKRLEKPQPFFFTSGKTKEGESIEITD